MPSLKGLIVAGNLGGGNVVEVVPVKGEVQNRWLFRMCTVLLTVHCYDMALSKTSQLD